jgi:hypothetical protein
MIYKLSSGTASSSSTNFDNVVVRGESISSLHKKIINSTFIRCNFDKVKVGAALSGDFFNCTFKGYQIPYVNLTITPDKNTGDFDFAEHIIRTTSKVPVYKIVHGTNGGYYIIYGYVPSGYVIVNPINEGMGKIRTNCFHVDHIYKVTSTPSFTEVNDVTCACMGCGENIPYKKNYDVVPTKGLDLDFSETCASGIHCFFTKEEAVDFLHDNHNSYKVSQVLAKLP